MRSCCLSTGRCVDASGVDAFHDRGSDVAFSLVLVWPGLGASEVPTLLTRRGGACRRRTGLVLNLKLRWDSGKGVASVGCVSYVPVLRTVEDVGTVDGVDDTLQVSVLEATAANHSEEFRFVREMFGALKGYKLVRLRSGRAR